MPTTMHQKVSYVNGAGNIQNIFNGADKEKDTSNSSDLWRAEKHLEKGCLQFIEHVTLPTKLRSCTYFISKKENDTRNVFKIAYPKAISAFNTIHYLYSIFIKNNSYSILKSAKLNNEDTE